MSNVPSSPREFFEQYLPGWFSSAGPVQATSPGALVFHVGAECYALRLDEGKLQVSSELPLDAILKVSLSPADFAELVGQGASLFDTGSSDRMFALRSLNLDPERAKLLRNVDGSVAFEITEGDLTRMLLLSPGATVAGANPPACTVKLAAADFWALTRAEKNPFELLMDGKIRVQGRMEVAMALSSGLLG